MGQGNLEKRRPFGNNWYGKSREITTFWQRRMDQGNLEKRRHFGNNGSEKSREKTTLWQLLQDDTVI